MARINTPLQTLYPTGLLCCVLWWCGRRIWYWNLFDKRKGADDREASVGVERLKADIREATVGVERLRQFLLINGSISFACCMLPKIKHPWKSYFHNLYCQTAIYHTLGSRIMYAFLFRQCLNALRCVRNFLFWKKSIKKEKFVSNRKASIGINCVRW